MLDVETAACAFLRVDVAVEEAAAGRSFVRSELRVTRSLTSML